MPMPIPISIPIPIHIPIHIPIPIQMEGKEGSMPTHAINEAHPAGVYSL